MGAYIIRRLLLIPVTLLLITILVFFLVRLIPGDVVDLIEAEMSAGSTTGIDREALEHALGMDVPIHIQYGRWLGVAPKPDIGFSGILQGNLGTSLRGGKSVSGEIMSRLPVTLELGLLAIVIGALVSIPVGVYSAIRQDTISDYGGRTIAILCISVPAFWVGTLIIIYPSIWWGWSPAMEVVPFFKDPLGNLGTFIIPAMIMGLQLTGGTMRMARTMMLEVLRQDYIRTAWSKGLRERVVIMRHAFKNALIPVVTIIGMQVPMLIGGMVIIEQIFSLPGMGRLLLEALGKRDYPMVSGINLIIATFVVVCNLLVDLTYGFLDPRIHYK